MKAAETIFALATPPGRSAIAIIRISGPLASMAPILFEARTPSAGQFLVQRLQHQGAMVDEALLLFMQSPHSSTGEDVCEFHCHGSQAVIDIILGQLGATDGFRMALPGEFSRRSFLNGKMDLSAVEGLADLIDSQTPAQLHQAWAQIDGALRAPVMAWRGALIEIAAKLEAVIDFSDEDLPDDLYAALVEETERLVAALAGGLDDGGVGEIVREGVKIALIGPVNAGKSTLLNAMAGRAAAIVSDEEGTTRDVIQVHLDLDGVPATVFDTAGIRSNSGDVEAEGIRRAVQLGQSVQLGLIILDQSVDAWPNQLSAMVDLVTGDRILVFNKADQPAAIADQRVVAAARARQLGFEEDDILYISAHDKADINHLLATISKRLVPHNHAETSVLITRARHRDAMQSAYEALCRALTHDLNQAPELAAEDYRLAATALGRITGEINVEELLGQIFSTFCIGK